MTRVKNITASLFAAFALALLFGSWMSSRPSTGQTLSILRAKTEILRPYIWFYAEIDNSDEGFQQQLDYGDPLRITTLLLQDWLANGDLARIDRRIAKVVSKWSLHEPEGRLSYTFKYGRLPAGWYSGMDSWSFPMLLAGLWQETGRPEYRNLAKKLIAQASRDVPRGGTVWRNGNHCWFSEYAWDGMSAAEEFHVLNGHLYALQSIKMLALALGDARLDSLYRCGVRGTKAHAVQFLGKRRWPLYMLNPETINQTHYVIYETMQFDALHELDSDPFFEEQAAARRNILQAHFPVYFRMSGDARSLMLSAVGAPHPYQIDTYPLTLRCTDGVITESHSLPHPTDSKTPLIRRAMLNVPTRLDPNGTTCRVTSEYIGQRLMLYELRPRPFVGQAQPGTDLVTSHDALFDAYLADDGSVVIDPKRRHSPVDAPDSYLDTQGRLVLTVKNPASLSPDGFLGFEFDSDGPLNLGVMINSNGRDFFRYYPATQPGNRTLVLLSPLGFDGGEQIDNIDRVTVFFYTDKQYQTVRLRPKRLTLFRNQVELHAYFSRIDPNFYTE